MHLFPRPSVNLEGTWWKACVHYDWSLWGSRICFDAKETPTALEA